MLWGSQEEDVNHLFACCPVTRFFWNSFANLMGVSWVFDRSCGGIVGSWVTSSLGAKTKATWNTIPAAIL